MKALKLLAGFVLVLGLLLGGLSFAMAAVTQPLEFPEQPALLTVRHGLVQVQKSGATTWLEVSDPVAVNTGDTIQTGVDSEASVNLYDQGVLHIAPNSTLTLTELLWSPEQPGVFKGQVFLEVGDLWSRVFDFVSPESGFEVTTSSTVATVRGTTFWVGAAADKSSRVYVDDHVVAVRSLHSDSARDVVGGEMVRLERAGRRAGLNSVMPSASDTVVIEKYRGWDQAYAEGVIDRQLEFARAARHIDPESPLYVFQRLAEDARLALASETRQQDLKARFMAGRVLDAYIEFADHKNLSRARLLLRQTKEFGGSSISAYPEVRRALLYFGHEPVATPEELEQVLEDSMFETMPLPPEVDIEVETDVSIETEPTGLKSHDMLLSQPEFLPGSESVLAPEVELQILRLEIWAEDKFLQVGERTLMHADLIWSDGREEEVAATWAVVTEATGQMVDDWFVAGAAPGVSTVTGYYRVGQVNYSAEAVISVTEPLQDDLVY